jgi:HAD superfamily hydrolase (TIGR01549 family)
LRPGAGEAYSTVAARRRVGILTNGFAETQRAKLDRFPELGRHSSATIISEEVGLMKPDPRLFGWASSHAGVRADRILYVGDSLRSDIQGGLSAGWNVAWIDGAPDRAPDGAFCFSRWEELLDRL